MLEHFLCRCHIAITIGERDTLRRDSRTHQQVVQRALEGVRDTILLARYGGDGFFCQVRPVFAIEKGTGSMFRSNGSSL